MIDSISDRAGSSPDLKRTRRHKPEMNGHHRLPPSSPEAERGVLGCILNDPAKCLPGSVLLLPDGPESFYDLRHQQIYITMLASPNPAFDLVLLYQMLRDRKADENVGGIPYLTELANATPSPANLSYYTEIVREKYILRKAIQVCTEAVDRIYQSEMTGEETIDRLEREVLGIRKFKSARVSIGIKELTNQALEQIEALWERQGKISGLETGFIDLDKYTDGMHPGDMIVIAAFPSVGKTSLAMNIAEHVLLRLGRPVGVFSLEMTAISLVTRFICSHARVNLRNVRDGFLSNADFPKISTAAGQIARCAIHFDDSSDLSVHQLRASARRMRQEHKIELVVIDYLQLMNAAGGARKVENRQQEVSDISNGIKQMAKELEIPVLVLSQLNDDGKLRESRAIGMDADGVWTLVRCDDEEGPTSDERDAEAITLFIQKNRNGPRDIAVPLTFLCPFTRFESAAKVSNDDYRPTHKDP